MGPEIREDGERASCEFAQPVRFQQWIFASPGPVFAFRREWHDRFLRVYEFPGRGRVAFSSAYLE